MQNRCAKLDMGREERDAHGDLAENWNRYEKQLPSTALYLRVVQYLIYRWLCCKGLNLARYMYYKRLVEQYQYYTVLYIRNLKGSVQRE